MNSLSGVAKASLAMSCGLSFFSARRRRTLPRLPRQSLGNSKTIPTDRHQRPARHMIDVHRRKTGLVVMRVPERELLGAMCRRRVPT
jgi:hypothetical protein